MVDKTVEDQDTDNTFQAAKKKGPADLLNDLKSMHENDQHAMSDNLVYWANKDVADICGTLQEKIDHFNVFIRSKTQALNHWKSNYNQYFSNTIAEGLYTTGVQNEFQNLNINHFTSILDTIKTLIVQQRPAFECRAANTDEKSETQTILANSLLDYYMKTKNLETHFTIAVFQALLYGESFIAQEWDASMGKIVDADPITQKPINEGDVKYTNLDPAHVIRDITKQTPHGHEWVILRTYKNKYDLMAQYPELAEDIHAINPASYDGYRNVRIENNINYNYDNSMSDDIHLYYFYHAKTTACPHGRFVKFLDDEIVLSDSALPYDGIPLTRISPKDRFGSIFGATVADDLRPIQYYLTQLYGMVCSSQTAKSLSNILLPETSNIAAASIQGALRVIPFSGKEQDMPRVLDLGGLDPQVFSTITMLEQKMQELSGINSVARGQPEANLKSGAALALLQANAISYNSGLAQSYEAMISNVGVTTINMLKRYANTPRIISITGKSNQTYLKDFTGQDLNGIDNVIVDLGNPLTNTIAGRENLAETYLQNKFITTPNEYMQVVSTGRLDAMTDSVEKSDLFIQAENELLLSGGNPVVVKTQMHPDHIAQHNMLLENLSALQDPDLVTRVTKHLHDHEVMWIQLTEQSPATLAALKIPPAPTPNAAPTQNGPVGSAVPGSSGAHPVQPPNGIPPIAGGAPGTEGPGIPQPPSPVKPTSPMAPMANHAQPHLPSLPTNPLTKVKGQIAQPMPGVRNTATSGTVRPQPHPQGKK